jgi:hypothetical protein
MDSSHFDLIVPLSGEGILRTNDFAFPFGQGECWLLPANLREYHVQPIKGMATLIRTYVPDLATLRAELKSAGHAKAAERTVFD